MTAPLVMSGALADHAQHRRRVDGTSLLIFEFVMPSGPRAKPVVCRVQKEYGTGEAAAVACSNRAHHLRSGVRVTVHAGACDRRGARIDLSSVELIEARDLDAAMLERHDR